MHPNQNQYQVTGIPGQPFDAVGQTVTFTNAKCCEEATAYQPPTLREQHEKNVGYHREQADKHDRAAAFLRENPAFDEFIQLVRAGVVQF